MPEIHAKFVTKLLMAGGVMTYACSERFLVANRFIRLFVRVICSVKVIGYVAMSYIDPTKTFRSAVFVCKFLTLLVCQQALLNAEPRLREALDTLAADLTRTEKATLRKYDRWLAFGWVSFFVLKVSIYGTVVLVQGPEMLLNSIYDWQVDEATVYHYVFAVINILIYTIFVTGFIVSTVTFYALVEVMFGQYGANCVKALNKRLNRKLAKHGPTTNSKIENVQAIRGAYRKYNRLRKRVNSSIGLLPFLWALMLFVEISVGITEVIIHRDKYTKFAFVYIFYEIFTFGSVFFAVCFQCENTNRQLTKEMLRGIRFIESDKTDERFLLTCEKSSLLLEMAVDPIVYASGWNIFSLDKKLIFSFLGSVVPFSVMIITGILQTRSMTN